MARQLIRSVQVMNIVSVCLFVIFSLHVLCHHGNANSDGGALTVVQEENQDNGEVTLELEDGDQESTVDANTDPFHPTHEWQAIKEGQAIPAGLHVRMNFETGLREAKLMDGESQYKYWKDGDREGMMNMDRKQFSMEELKRALKDFKTTQLDDTDLKREAEVKQNFRSYDQLKKDFQAMNMDIQTDAEIIEDLLTRMKHKDVPRDDLLTILTDLEYYLHQIDNAILFRDAGGLPYLVKLLNRTDDEAVQIEAAMVLGAAMSSNPKVQIGAVEAGALELLLRLLSTQSSVKLRRKILFAVSAHCRHFPFAQQRFLSLGGLSVLGSIFDEASTEKLQVKALAFLNDLLTEKILTEEHSNPDKSSEAEKLRQYQKVELKQAMLEQGWCDRLPRLLSLPDHESRETTLNIMATLAESCTRSFKESQEKLAKLETEYLTLAKNDADEEDDYFNNIVLLIRKLTSVISSKKNHVHDGSEF